MDAWAGSAATPADIVTGIDTSAAATAARKRSATRYASRGGHAGSSTANSSPP